MSESTDRTSEVCDDCGYPVRLVHRFPDGEQPDDYYSHSARALPSEPPAVTEALLTEFDDLMRFYDRQRDQLPGEMKLGGLSDAQRHALGFLVINRSAIRAALAATASPQAARGRRDFIIRVLDEAASPGEDR